MHSAIVREAESTDISIAVQHMLILVVASLKSGTSTANCHVSGLQYNSRLPQNTCVVHQTAPEHIGGDRLGTQDFNAFPF